MNLFRRRNPGRELGELSAASRRRKALAQHEKVLAVARQIRAEKGMLPSPALQPDFH
jgi:hypothetical protein